MKQVFGYMKGRPNGQILIDTSKPDLSKFKPEQYDWSQFYPGIEEEIPYDMPEERGDPVKMIVYVDADHAHDKVTWHSVTGILLQLNNTVVKTVSKPQKTVETSSYGSEMVAARVACELILEYRYKLRMLGVLIDGPALLMGDNMSVVISSTLPSSQLKKKHQACCYHRVRETIACSAAQFVHIKTGENKADVLTKPLTSQKFFPFVYDFRSYVTLTESGRGYIIYSF